MGDRNAYVWACDDKTYVEEAFPNAFHDDIAWKKAVHRLWERYFTDQTEHSKTRTGETTA